MRQTPHTTPKSPLAHKPDFVDVLYQPQPELFRARTDDDYDYAQAVTNLFIRKGHPNPSAWMQTDWMNSGYVNELATASPTRQMDLINRIFRLILGSDPKVHPNETMQARYCLTNNLPVDSWLLGIADIVIPDAMRLGLI